MARLFAYGKGDQFSRARVQGDFCVFYAKGDKWKVHGRVDGAIPGMKLVEFQKARLALMRQASRGPRSPPRICKGAPRGSWEVLAGTLEACAGAVAAACANARVAASVPVAEAGAEEMKYVRKHCLYTKVSRRQCWEHPGAAKLKRRQAWVP